jgi:hypothetical protein
VDDGERRFGLENVSSLFILLDFLLTFFFTSLEILGKIPQHDTKERY